MSEPKSISFKCERCGHSSESKGDFIKGEPGLDALGCISAPIAVFALCLTFLTEYVWAGILCMLGLAIVKSLTGPKVCCPRCDGREIKEIYHY